MHEKQDTNNRRNRMAKTNLYSLYDKEAETCVGPIVAEMRHAPAIRMFGELLSDQQTLPGRYPKQFQLMHVGTQDTDTAEITAIKPTVIATGVEWLQQRENAANRPAQENTA